MRSWVRTWALRLAIGGLVLTGLGIAAVVVASIQGMALVPGGSILDGYDIGLLPWMDVGTWLVPIGGVIVAAAGALAIWTGGSILARVISVVPIVAVLFWGLVVAIDMGPHTAVPDVPPTGSSLATAVYSRPANTIWFLLLPAAGLLVLAAVGRRRVP